MVFSDLQLSRRLERAEGYACAQFAQARRRLFPDSGAEYIECAGAYAVFDGIASPVTQSFGLGIFEDLTPTTLDTIEHFFFERGAPVNLEVSPFAGVGALDLLCARNYRPIELSNVLCRSTAELAGQENRGINVRIVRPDESHLWATVNTRGWIHDYPELHDFLSRTSNISSNREHTVRFLAEIDGQPGAAGALSIHQGVALFAGAATVPEFRRRGLQTALLQERMRYAFEHGCDLAMMVTEPGARSQRNAERAGFKIAYTRTKWQLSRQ
jgi:GNAT superfamily N-acetyltransferase